MESDPENTFRRSPKRRLIARLRAANTLLKAMAATLGALAVLGTSIFGFTRFLDQDSKRTVTVREWPGVGPFFVDSEPNADPVSLLGVPPSYLSAEHPREHCSVWRSWLQSKDAVRGISPVVVEVRGESASPVTVTRIKPVIYAKRAASPGVLVVCTSLAHTGPFPGTNGTIELSDPEAPLRISAVGAAEGFQPEPRDDTAVPEQGASQRFDLPPGRLTVLAGEIENLIIVPHVPEGWLYEYGLEVTIFSNGETETELHGTSTDPFRAVNWSGKLPGFDWNPSNREWVVVP